jgi:hypothetical protein
MNRMIRVITLKSNLPVDPQKLREELDQARVKMISAPPKYLVGKKSSFSPSSRIFLMVSGKQLGFPSLSEMGGDIVQQNPLTEEFCKEWSGKHLTRCVIGLCDPADVFFLRLAHTDQPDESEVCVAMKPIEYEKRHGVFALTQWKDIPHVTFAYTEGYVFTDTHILVFQLKIVR